MDKIKTLEKKIDEQDQKINQMLQHIQLLENILQQIQVWQQNFRIEMNDEHLIEFANRIEVLHREGRI